MRRVKEKAGKQYKENGGKEQQEKITSNINFMKKNMDKNNTKKMGEKQKNKIEHIRIMEQEKVLCKVNQKIKEMKKKMIIMIIQKKQKKKK